jgi:hypothetical protein
MAKNWWDDAPIADDDNWWASAPMADGDGAAPTPAAQRPEIRNRTAGEVVGDTGLSMLQGAMGFAQMPGTIYGLVSGNMDNAYTGFFQRGMDAADSLKSEPIRQRGQQLQERIDEREGLLGKFAEGFVGTITDPALMGDQLARMAPTLAAGAGLGTAAQKGLTTAAGTLGVNALTKNSPAMAQAAVAASRAAGVAPTVGAVGVNAMEQGQDIAFDALEQAKEIPLELWHQNDPGFRELVAAGTPEEEAREIRANQIARRAGLKAGAVSVATQALPGGRAIETALLRPKLPGGRLSSAVGVGAKETISEGLEEFGGSIAKDMQLARVDPSIDVLGRAAGAAGQGAAVGGPLGAAIGAAAPRQTSSFTPTGSVTAEAGLPPIVIPTGGLDAGRSDTSVPGTAVGSQQLGADAARSLEAAVADGDVARLAVGGRATGVAPDGGSAAVVPGASPQRTADLTSAAGNLSPRQNPVARTADGDLLARAVGQAAESDIAPAQAPKSVWFGRRGDGYLTEGDAEQALSGRQRREPSLQWRVEPTEGGRFRLAGYETAATEQGQARSGEPQDVQPRAQSTQPQQARSGEPVDRQPQEASQPDSEWREFPPQSGTLGIPREEMPQIKAEARGALVNFLNAREIASSKDESVDPRTLLPTQAQFSEAKVAKAMDFKGGERSILVSADNRVLDGHHQWMAALRNGQPVKVIRLDAPIDRLLQEVKAFPSATVDTSSRGQDVIGRQFINDPSVRDTARSVTFASKGELGAVKAGLMRDLNNRFERVDNPNGSITFTRKETDDANARGAGQEMDGQPRGDARGGEGQQRGDAVSRQGQPGAPQVSGRATQERGDAADVERDLRAIERGWKSRTGTDVRLSAVRPQDTTNSRLAQAIANAFSAPISFIKGADGFDAMTINGRLYVNADGTDAPAMALVMHEIGHNLPADLKQELIDAVMETVTPEQRANFLTEFSAYASDSEAMQNEELAMRIIEQDAQNADFWQALADRMGDTTFGRLARNIINTLDRLLAGFRREDSSEFTSDIKRVREAVADAYAQALERQGGQPSLARRKKEQVGDFQVVTDKDGTMTVLGDSDVIREQIPEDVKGRVTQDGIRFVTADAQRVRAALEGRQVAYSRAGAVLGQKPMKAGKYVGAPAKFDTPAKIPTLRKLLRQLAVEGERGRYWYENSSREVLRMVGGDVREARKFVALLAIYSPQAKVDANSTFALRAWAQHKAGQPIDVKTKVMDDKAQAAMDDVDAFWSGEKTGNFFFNLLREIDPTTEGKQGATIDMWMMRAGQYDNDAPTATQYAFMEDETNRLAAELGWEPQQVQAAIWVAMKARMENSGVKKRTEAISEKKGWIRFDRETDPETGKAKKVRVILDEHKHRDNWLKQAFAHDPTTDDTQAAKFDFADGLLRHIGQISFEARPGRTTGVLPGIHDAPYAQQVEFQQAVQKAFYDDEGRDLLAHYLGLLVDDNILSPGVWQGEVSPSTQTLAAMAPAKGEDGKSKVDPAQAKLLNVYAAVAGLVARQEGVGWHRPFYATTKRVANALDVDIGRPVNPREAQDLEAAVGKWMTDKGHQDWQNQFAFVSSPKGIRLVNFGIITNDILQSEIVKVAESVLPNFDYRVFASDGDMPTNNWKENSDGQGYVQRIRAEGRPDVLDWARTVLAPRVQRVFTDFGERYDWGNPGELRFSAARDGGRRPESGRATPGSLEASERAAAQKALTPLPGAPNVPGFHGPDPRLVAVAEKYARDNGITLRRQAEYVQVNEDRARRLAEAYAAMPHAPQDPRVREAYANLIRQTRAQYDALVADGYKFWFINLEKADNVDYVSTPWNAMRDIRANKRMGVFPTDDGFGSSADFDPANNPLLADTGLRWPSGSLYGPVKRVLANDLFRAVHDAFGHGLEGSGFRAQGEENAWQAHVRLFTGSAVGAITSETRGQNSWLNYGPNGEANRNAKVEDTVFADQKTGLMPEWTWTEGRVGDMPMPSWVAYDNSADNPEVGRFETRAEAEDFMGYKPLQQPGFAITEAMRDKVSAGLPMFSARRNPQTETPEFKAWFGDSKVRVPMTSSKQKFTDMPPLVVYHATNADIAAFESGRETVNSTTFGDDATERHAIFFAEDPSFAEAYIRKGGGGNVMPVYLSIQNPLYLGEGISGEDLSAIMAQADRSKMTERDFYYIKASDWWSVFDGDFGKEFVRAARAAGFDGAQMIERDPDGKRDDNFDVWVAFDPEQIKSATGNRGTFDPENPDIRFSASRQPINGQNFTLPAEGKWVATRRALQDYFLRVREVQDAVIMQGGVVGEAQDVYRAEERSYGRIQEQLKDFAEKWVRPMVEKAGRAKIDLDELALYAYARHAEERNANIAGKNKRFADGGSGMTNAEAQQILAKFQQEGKEPVLADLHKDLMAITATTRIVLLDEGLISQEEFDALEAQYENYVPLRGFENVDNDGKRVLRTAGGKGFNVRGAETMKALGRSSRAGNVIENIISDYERAIVRAERNQVGKAFLDFVTTNPDADLWEIDAVRTSRSIDSKTGQVRYTDITDKGEDTIGVKVGGQEVYIKIHDPLLAKAMRQAYKDDTGTVPRWMQNTLGMYTNWMRNVLTRYNVAFSAVNAARDLQAGAIAALDDLGTEGLKLYAKYYGEGLAASFRNEVGRLDQAKRRSDRYFEEFRAAGGTTGGFFMRDADEIRADIRTMLVAAGASPKDRMEAIKGSKAGAGVRAALRTLEVLGSASENAARVAAYRAAREMGRSPAEAASIAKNLTTNFNRKGEWGHLANSLYLFFNAAVQGSARVLKALKNPKVQSLMAGVTAASMGLAFMAAGMGDDEDGEAYWDKIPEHEKERNLIIMLPPGVEMDGAEKVGMNGRYIKIPTPYGFNVFPVLGYQLADVMRYAQDRNRGASPAKVGVRLLGAVAGAYNPLGGGFDVTNPVELGLAVSPTAGDLLIQLAAGVNSFGQPVGQMKTPYDPRPDSEIAGPREAGSVSQKIARWLNAATGGNAGRSGDIDVQPATINNLARTFGGGAGDFLWSVLVNLPFKAVSPDAEIELREVPIAKAFAGRVDKSNDMRRFYENREAVLKEYNAAVREMKMGIEIDYDGESRGLQALAKTADSMTKSMSVLRREEVRIEDDKEMTRAEKALARRELERQRVQLARDFNRIFNDVMRESRGSQ